MKLLIVISLVFILSNVGNASEQCPIEKTKNEKHSQYEVQKKWEEQTLQLDKSGFSVNGFTDDKNGFYTTEITSNSISLNAQVFFEGRKEKRIFLHECKTEEEKDRPINFSSDVSSKIVSELNGGESSIFFKLDLPNVNNELRNKTGYKSDLKSFGFKLKLNVLNNDPSTSFVQKYEFLNEIENYWNKQVKAKSNGSGSVILPTILPTLACDLIRNNIEIQVSYDVVDQGTQNLVVQKEVYSQEFLMDLTASWSELPQEDDREKNIFNVGIYLEPTLAHLNSVMTISDSYLLLKGIMPNNIVEKPNYESKKWMCLTDRIQNYENKQPYSASINKTYGFNNLEQIKEAKNVW